MYRRRDALSARFCPTVMSLAEEGKGPDTIEITHVGLVLNQMARTCATTVLSGTTHRKDEELGDFTATVLWRYSTFIRFLVYKSEIAATDTLVFSLPPCALHSFAYNPHLIERL
jgi:hypothetical protein